MPLRPNFRPAIHKTCEEAKCENREGPHDVIAARKTAAIAKAQADKEAAVVAVAKATKDLDDLSK